MLCAQRIKVFIDKNPYDYDPQTLKTLRQRVVTWHKLGGRIDSDCICCKPNKFSAAEFCVSNLKRFYQHARSRFATAGREFSISSDRSDDSSPLPFPIAPQDIIDAANNEQVDPVYYLLRQATTIRSGKSPSATSPPPLSTVPNIVTDSSGCSDSSTSAYSSASQLAPNSYLSSQEHLSLSHCSAPTLSSLKSPSMDSQNSDYGSDKQQRHLPPKPVNSCKKPPKLQIGMKSLSLDSHHNSAPYYPSKISPIGSSPTNRRLGPVNRHILNHSSIDTDDTSNASGSPCLSNSESAHFLPHGQFAVVREYSATGPEELNIRLGERLNVLESSDPHWWQASKPDGRVGLVPAVSLARVQPHEKLIRVNQNLQLCASNTSLRLLKDQIVFGYKDDSESDSRIRTQDDYRAKCPTRYLIFFE